MSKTRFIHPALFKDEDFIQASFSARLMLIGLWTEAWDDGVFEWNAPLLKQKFFPNDAIDPEGPLAELKWLGFVRPFTIEGSHFGALRGFRFWQKTQRTTDGSGVLPEKLRKYTGSNDSAEFGRAS